MPEEQRPKIPKTVSIKFTRRKIETKTCVHKWEADETLRIIQCGKCRLVIDSFDFIMTVIIPWQKEYAEWASRHDQKPRLRVADPGEGERQKQ